MKKLLFFSFVLLLSITVSAQKKRKSPKKAPKKATEFVKYGDTMDVQDEVQVGENTDDDTIDTLHIAAGKEYVFLVEIEKYKGYYAQMVGDPKEEEKAEIENNFGKKAIEVIILSKHIFVLFENKQTLDLSDRNNSFNAAAYWSGKLKKDVQVKEGYRLSTEFVAEQKGSKKESSYVVNTKKFKKEIENISSKNNVTKNSFLVMELFLKQFRTPIRDKHEDNADLFNMDNKKVKSVVSYIQNKKKKILIKKISLLENGFPSLVEYFSSDGDANGSTNFIYNNGLLVSTKNGEGKKTTINYDDGLMICTENVGDADETTIYSIEKNELVKKNYTLMLDDNYSHQNTFCETKTENNCSVFYINNKVWSRDCFGDPGKYPFVHTYTSFQNGELLQFRKTKIEKKDDKTYLKYYSKAENETDKDNFELFGTYTLNEKNLVNSFSFNKDGVNKVLRIDYTYFN